MSAARKQVPRHLSGPTSTRVSPWPNVAKATPRRLFPFSSASSSMLDSPCRRAARARSRFHKLLIRPHLTLRRPAGPSRRVGYTIVVAHHSAGVTPRDRDAALRAAPQDEVVCESSHWKGGV